jgi:hypothetical protein
MYIEDDEYIYTGGKTLVQLGISSTDDIDKLPKYNIKDANSVIPFSDFVEDDLP